MPVFQPSPWVSSVPVLAGEIWVKAGVAERLLHGLRDAGVQGADDADDGVVADELGGVLLADGRLGLVVERLGLELDAGDEVLLVGRLCGEVGGVLDSEAEGGQVTCEGCVYTDDDGLLRAAAGVAAFVARPTGGEGECACGEHCGEYEQGTVSHDGSFPWRGLLVSEVPCRSPGRTGW